MTLKHATGREPHRNVEVKFEIGGEGLVIEGPHCYPGLSLDWVDVPALIGMLREAQKADGRTVS